MWYTLKVAQDGKKRENKKSQKTFKKVLTSLTKCDMIVKLLFERTAQQLEPWKLNNVRSNELKRTLRFQAHRNMGEDNEKLKQRV